MVPIESTAADDARHAPLLLVPGADTRDLSAGPAETFVLACVDGQSSQVDIAQTTGLRVEEVASIVDSLVARGVVAFAAPNSHRQAVRGPVSATMQSGSYSLLGGSEQSLDLSAAQQHQLLDLDRRLASLGHYELLGVGASADDKAIRAAYYQLVRTFHPDRFFGKQLGSFESKLLRVFAKITEAYDVLHRDDTRAEYDRYIAAKRRTLDFESHLNDPDRQTREIESALRRIEQAAADSVVPASTTVRRPSGAFVADPEARRRALARKLGHSSVPPSRSPSSAAISSVPPSSSSSRAAEDLRQRYAQRLARAREEQRNHYVALSNEAAARNDLVAAANALRVACSLAPENHELAGDLAELERRAAQEMWESYAERAKYAAIEGRPDEAAECYVRAAFGHPSASLLERAAFFTLEAGGDLKQAAQLARQAIALAPNSAKCRLTLAQIYASAKLRESALAELERARALEPEQPIIKEWIARVKRGDI
ncbi:MAG TPA: DnaJ domain-containing protein [Polyangiaceae bacterium]